MPFRRPNRKTWYLSLHTPAGDVRRSTGTTDKKIANAMERLISDLEAKRDWLLLNAVVGDGVSLGELYDASATNTLEDLRKRLMTPDVAEVDIEPLVEKWLTKRARDIKPDTVAHYRYAVRSLIPTAVPFPVSRFRKKVINDWLDAYRGSTATRIKARAALSDFGKFLVGREVLELNPVRATDRPKTPAPRVRFEEAETMVLLADAQGEPFRTLSAILGGTGIDVSDALRLRPRDIDFKLREIHAAGTKNHNRNRVVRVAEWAWPFVQKHCVGLPADSLLFGGIDRWLAGDSHRAACHALQVEDYRQKDQRHSYAVRAIRIGTPAELVARQLGHTDATMVLKVYGRFLPNHDERAKWELMAAEHDQQQAERKQDSTLASVPSRVPVGATDSGTHTQKSRKPAGSRDLANSRGGTRTRDPGIMSAVL
jgi:integrase